MRHAPMRWEYWIEEGEPNVDRLNELGADGWELIAPLAGKLIFNRRRPEEPPEAPRKEAPACASRAAPTPHPGERPHASHRQTLRKPTR